MDVTGNLSGAIAALPAQAKPLLEEVMDRLATLEAQSARDTKVIVDEVVAAIVPQLQAITQTVNAVADQALTVIRRIDGLTVTVKLGPEMKDHVPVLAALAALAMLLGTVVFLVLYGQKPGDMAMLGLGTAIGGIVTGLSPSFSSRGTTQTINAGTANTVNDPNQPALTGQKEKP